MDIFDEIILQFWSALCNNKVKFIMVGGYATNMQGYQRYTGDMDIWIEDTDENRNNLVNAFIEADMGNFPMLKNIQFIPGWTDFRLNNGLKLDVMTTMKGLEEYTFDYCLSMATIATIENVAVPFLHINQLIQNKKAVNRPKDQIDVIELEKIKLLRD